MDELLASLMVGLAPADKQAVEQWWAALPDAAHTEIARLFDPRGDSCAFVPISSDSGLWRWKRLPLRVNSQRLHEAEEPDTNWDWQYLEYQLAHPEEYPIVLYENRVFYIGGVGIGVAA